MSAFLHVVKKAEEKDPAASILVEQVQNFAKKKPTRSEKTMRHVVVLRNLSTRTYKHARSTGILRLPCRSTLERFMGSSRGEVGVTELVKQRLSAELASRLSLRARACSSIVDEMRVKKRLLYYAQRCLHRRGDGLWCQLPPKKQQMSLSWPTHSCVSSLTAFQFRSRYRWHIRFREKLH